MVQVAGNEVTATATGESNYILLAEGEWMLHCRSTSWGDTDIQWSTTPSISSSWADLKENGVVVNFTTNDGNRVPGNTAYRMDVNAYTADIVMTANRIG